MNSPSREVNFDGLVGPTHHYAGLSFGNEASARNRHQPANPRLAARQGLDKMKALADAGFVQGVLPPHERPHLPWLRRLGFYGSDAQVLSSVAASHPELLASLSSASAMWVANAATVSPSVDSLDGKVHFTAANLNNKFHRAIEADTTSAVLAAVFNHAHYFQHHPALPAQAMFSDEGAANHNRLGSYQQPGMQLFVYGKRAAGGEPEPQHYPARQTLEASQAVARLHQLDPLRCMFARQDAGVIDQGVFHNDVIAVSNERVLFYHQHAFADAPALLARLQRAMERLDQPFEPIEVPAARVTVQAAVNSYLFNSQLLSRDDGRMTIVVPEEVRQDPAVWDYLNDVIGQGGALDRVQVFDLRESMRNGGGPACLRLRVLLTASELQAVNPGALLTEQRYHQLREWIDRHYRDRLTLADLADPLLLDEVRTALDQLTQIMNLGAIYPFQQ